MEEMEKVVLVTGGGRGIGAATARLFAARGYRVCINYCNNDEAAQRTVGVLREAGGDCCAIKADLSREQDVIALFHAVDDALGRLDVLVNNAAILLPQKRLEDFDAERINRLFACNVTGAMLCCREAVKRMSTRHGGRGGAIVNVSSAASRTGSPNEYIDYAASKGAIDTLTKGLAQEVAEEGIRVNAVRPGFIHTDMHADGGEPDRIERLRSSIPMKRGGQPEEIAEAIYWLASDAASYCTGALLDLAGGR